MATELNNSNDIMDEMLPSKDMDTGKIEEAVTVMLNAFGENPARKGLIRTPERVAKMFTELLSGYRVDPIKLVNDALFEVTYDEMVIVRDIEFYSLCEHHMLPFLRRMVRATRHDIYFVFKSMDQGSTFRIRVPKHPTADPNYRRPAFTAS